MFARHSRRVCHPRATVRPWLDRIWVEDEDALFPRDVLPPFRVEEGGRVVMGHGPLPFVQGEVSPSSWRVRTPYGGWHGFTLVEDGDGCEVTHELSIDGPWWLELSWRWMVAPGHAWAVEAILDRLEIALERGAPPRITSRPLPWSARVGRTLLVDLLPMPLTRAVRRWFLGKIAV